MFVLNISNFSICMTCLVTISIVLTEKGRVRFWYKMDLPNITTRIFLKSTRIRIRTIRVLIIRHFL